MARVKSDKANLIIIRNWEHADELLREIGSLQQGIKEVEGRAKKKIDSIKADMVGQTKRLDGDIERYRASLEAFAVARPDDFGKQRSRKLNFGTLGWRLSTAIKITKKTLGLIREKLSPAKAKLCIRVKESVDKEALAKLTDEQLAGIKARREPRDVFFVEPDIPKAAKY